jgi:hypothetical protein
MSMVEFGLHASLPGLSSGAPAGYRFSSVNRG